MGLRGEADNKVRRPFIPLDLFCKCLWIRGAERNMQKEVMRKFGGTS